MLDLPSTTLEARFEGVFQQVRYAMFSRAEGIRYVLQKMMKMRVSVHRQDLALLRFACICRTRHMAGIRTQIFLE